ncbi:MAG: hypothetical protein OSA89_20360 [Mariniblastus sp.]|nr:hypothetical protein [Mariniblastus sp.]
MAEASTGLGNEADALAKHAFGPGSNYSSGPQQETGGGMIEEA